MKTAILMLPGRHEQASRKLFDTIKNKLSAKFFVGEASFGDVKTIQNVFDAIDKALEKLGKYPEVIFLGKSFGGANAIRHQLKFRRAKALVLLAPALEPTHEMKQIKVPVLIIHAADDAVVPISYSEKLVEFLPNATLMKISSGGHGYEGNEARVAEEIERWLSKL